MGVITLSPERTGLALVEEFAHDCLVLAGVGRRDPTTSRLVDMMAVGLGRGSAVHFTAGLLAAHGLSRNLLMMALGG